MPDSPARAQRPHTRSDVDVPTGASGENVPFLKKCAEFTGESAERKLFTPKNHVRKPRVYGKVGHRLPVNRECSPAVDRPEQREDGAGLRHVRSRRRIDEP